MSERCSDWRATEGSHVLVSQRLLAQGRRVDDCIAPNLTYIVAELEKDKHVPISRQRCSPQADIRSARDSYHMLETRGWMLLDTWTEKKKKKKDISTRTSLGEPDGCFWLPLALWGDVTQQAPAAACHKLPRGPCQVSQDREGMVCMRLGDNVCIVLGFPLLLYRLFWCYCDVS